MAKVTIDQEACIGCGACTAVAPEIFELGEDGKARVKKEKLNAKELKQAQEGAEVCPVQAIKIEE